MSIFFEVLKKRSGFSRIGRIKLATSEHTYIRSPHILIPINKSLLAIFDFVKQFEDQKMFLIHHEKYLKKSFKHTKYKSSIFIYSPLGTFQRFKEIFTLHKSIFHEDNIFPIIPFNGPNTILDKEFCTAEIKHYLKELGIFLRQHPQTDFGITIKLFDYPEMMDLYIPFIKKHKNIKLLNLSDLFEDLYHFRDIIGNVITLKSELDNNLLLMASGRIQSNFYPLLTYLGFDLIDASYNLFLATEDFYDTIEDLLPIYKIKYFPCTCIACRAYLEPLVQEKYSEKKTKFLCLHNLLTAKAYMNRIKQYLKYEDFRGFLEKSSLHDTSYISLLKILDKNHFDSLQYETPLIQKDRPIRCIGPLSYFRPDFVEFRRRLINTFTPESWTKLLIIVPCSAKKPYSQSKSHQKFLRVLRKFSEFPSFQEIILTSPLGAIPRQLENVYPANSYDISVTGEWDAEEIALAGDMLIDLLGKYDPHIPVLCHLDEAYLEILDYAREKIKNPLFLTEVSEGLTSSTSLESLRSLIEAHKKDISIETGYSHGSDLTKTWPRKVHKILDYQYGPQFSHHIFPNKLQVRHTRFHDKLEIYDKTTQELLGVFDSREGLIQLTLNAAQRAIDIIDSQFIIFDGDTLRGNTLFRPGVKAFSSDLIPQNYCFILNPEKTKAIAIGKVIVGSNFIQNAKMGRVAKLEETR